MGRCVNQLRPGNVETDTQVGGSGDRQKRFTNGLVHVADLQGLAAEVEQAPAKFRPAGLQHLLCGQELLSDCLGRSRNGAFHGDELAGDAGEVLRKGVMQFDGQTGPFRHFQLGGRTGDLRTQEFPAAPLDKPVQNPDPKKEPDDPRNEGADDDEELAWRPPRRTGKDDDVRRRPGHDGKPVDPWRWCSRNPVLDVEQADSRGIDLAANRDAGVFGSNCADIHRHDVLSAVQVDVSVVVQDGLGIGDSAADANRLAVELRIDDSSSALVAELTEDVSALRDLNRSKMLELTDFIKSACAEPLCFEELLKVLFDRYGLTLNLSQYVLVGASLRSYLAYLLDEKALETVFSENKLLWHTL